MLTQDICNIGYFLINPLHLQSETTPYDYYLRHKTITLCYSLFCMFVFKIFLQLDSNYVVQPFE